MKAFITPMSSILSVPVECLEPASLGCTFDCWWCDARKSVRVSAISGLAYDLVYCAVCRLIDPPCRIVGG